MTLRFLTAGESHGPALVAILEGMPAGLPLSADDIDKDLARRQQGFGAGPRMKIEHDHARLLGGVMEGRTIGAPVAVIIDNLDHEKWAGRAIAPFTVPRPGHADLSGVLKYGYSDLRPALERASARETAARVAVGAICRMLLAQFDIQVGGYVQAIGEVQADLSRITYPERLRSAETSELRCPEPEAAARMRERIRKAMQERDTAGGVIEAVTLGLPPGLGSHVHWERKLEAQIGAAILSIPAIKGVEIGPAFENAALPGTQAQDAIRLDGSDLIRLTNHSGGLEGGMTTGQPLVVRAAMKPIATTLTPQSSVDLSTGVPTDTHYERSDFCPVPRAVVVVEAMLAFVIANALIEKLGGDSMDEMRLRYNSLRRASLSDVKLDHQEHTWWPE